MARKRCFGAINVVVIKVPGAGFDETQCVD